MCSRLQPYVIEAATMCARGCSPMYPGRHMHMRASVTAGELGLQRPGGCSLHLRGNPQGDAAAGLIAAGGAAAALPLGAASGPEWMLV